MKKVYIIHTSLVSYHELNELFREFAPDVKIHNIVDDSLLADVMLNGYVDEKIEFRLSSYIKAAEKGGADLIFSQCSSMGDGISKLKNITDIPILKVDDAMAEEAVKSGARIGVIATVKSTLTPSINLIKEKAVMLNKEIEIQEHLVDGALRILMEENDRETHNRLVLDEVRKASKTCDVIVLAQGSMTVLLPELKNVKVPILTSPVLGVKKAAEMLR